MMLCKMIRQKARMLWANLVSEALHAAAMARQDGVMRNISNLVVSVENESFTLMEKALRLLVTAGKGVVEECMPDGDAASADDAASAEAARRIVRAACCLALEPLCVVRCALWRSKSNSSWCVGRGCACVHQLAKLDSEMEEGTKAGAEVLLRAQTLKALIRNGPEFFTQLDDGAVESMGSFSEAVLAGKSFRPVNKASAFLAQDGDKREERIAGFLARPPLKTIADDYGYEVKVHTHNNNNAPLLLWRLGDCVELVSCHVSPRVSSCLGQGEDRAIDDDVAEVHTREQNLECSLTLKQYTDPVITYVVSQWHRRCALRLTVSCTLFVGISPCNHTFDRPAIISLFAERPRMACPSTFVGLSLLDDCGVGGVFRLA